MSPGRTKTTWVVVADGAKALILVNEGTDRMPNLRVDWKSEIDAPPSREINADRPGRRSDSGPGQRSAMEPVDAHRIGSDRFIDSLADRIDRAVQSGRSERLVLVAPPRVLGRLRASLTKATADAVAAELRRDLTGQTVSDIEMQVAKALYAVQ
ncbi:MAG: host attachment family protein [Paracoccaceae bacterium]|nr:host attachment family protein [Paracoccaceae bacterium]